MTLVVSTSSPWVSVAVFGPGGLVSHGRMEARQAASGAVVTLAKGALDTAGAGLEDVEAFVADVGPGSFSGVKVGVTMVKSWGWALGRPVGGLTSFDLVSRTGAVAIPVRRGLWFFREPGKEACPVSAPPEGALGHGWDGGSDFPDAALADLAGVALVDPPELLPTYLAEPSISVPKDPSVLKGAR